MPSISIYLSTADLELLDSLAKTESQCSRAKIIRRGLLIQERNRENQRRWEREKLGLDNPPLPPLFPPSLRRRT